jgi:hypothetical protein
MPLGYYEAACLLFGNRTFTTREFAIHTASRRAAKILSEFKSRGLAERKGRGRYRLLSPGARPDRRATEWDRARKILLHSGLPMAWSGPTAVESWTAGRYFVSPSVFRREWHLNVPEGAARRWADYLRRHRLSADHPLGLGNRIILHTVRRLRRVNLGGEPVIPREEVLELIRAHRGIYAEADALLEDGPD